MTRIKNFSVRESLLRSCENDIGKGAQRQRKPLPRMGTPMMLMESIAITGFFDMCMASFLTTVTPIPLPKRF